MRFLVLSRIIRRPKCHLLSARGCASRLSDCAGCVPHRTSYGHDCAGYNRNCADCVAHPSCLTASRIFASFPIEIQWGHDPQHHALPCAGTRATGEVCAGHALVHDVAYPRQGHVHRDAGAQLPVPARAAVPQERQTLPRPPGRGAAEVAHDRVR